VVGLILGPESLHGALTFDPVGGWSRGYGMPARACPGRPPMVYNPHMKNTSRPLRLEPVEDRLVPSFPFPSDISITHRGSVVLWSGDDSNRSRGHEFESRTDRAGVFRPAEFTVFERGMRDVRSITIFFVLTSDRTESSKDQSAAAPRTRTLESAESDRVTTAGDVKAQAYDPEPASAGVPPVSTSAVKAPALPVVPPQPAADTAVAVASSNAAAVVRIVQSAAGVTGSNPGAATGQPASNPSGVFGNPQEVRSEPAAARPANGAIQVTDDAGLSTSGVPVPAGSTPDQVPDPRPAPTALDRVLDAAFPDGIPFLGAVTVDPMPAGVVSIASRIGSLADVSLDDGAAGERWAWLSAGVLAAAGVYATTRPSRRRHPVAAQPAGSELARWETRHDGSP
jgi:hypothetical protein